MVEVESGCVVTGCGRPTDTYLCNGCWSRLERDLKSVDWLAGQLDLVLTRQARAGNVAVGFVRGAGEQQLVVNLGASDARLALRDLLASWVRDLHETHAPRWEECTDCGARWFGGVHNHDVRPPVWCTGTWEQAIEPLTVEFDSGQMARWLLRHPTWIRLHVPVDDLFEEVTRAVARAWRLIDRAPDRVYLGICSATVFDADGESEECPADLYAEAGAAVARCRECETDHVVDSRRRMLARAVEDQLVPTGVLVGLVGRLGKLTTSSAIRNLKARGKIAPKIRDQAGHIRLKQDDDEGVDTFRVGDVLDAIHSVEKRLEKTA